VYIRECPVVLRNILLPSSGLKSKPSKEAAEVAVPEARSVTAHKAGTFNIIL
jgi:hypothetical protein